MQLKEGRKKKSYSQNVKSFALTLNFYSKRAYEYVRQKFGQHLPSQSTLRNWYQSVDGSPGILTESLNTIKHRVKNAATSNKKLFLALMIDEMSIRRQVIWNDSLKKFIGYLDFGTNQENSEEATEALVFLVNAVNEKWKVPVAYYFSNHLSGQEKANIVTDLLINLYDTGAHVVSLTFDGASSNLSMANILGADLKNPEKLKPYFSHPCSKCKVYIILDICHMIKLVRNILASRGVIYTEDGGTIKWNFIQNLEHFQRNAGLHVANKLTKQHVNFQNSKMKVKLATQTISNSVADALDYLKTKDLNFVDCEATVEFLKIFNNLFDIFNSKNFFNSSFKRPFSSSTKAEYFNFFDKAKKYILSLKIDRQIGVNVNNQVVFEKQQITKSICKVGFIGFLIAIETFKNLYKDYVESFELSFILRYKFSQDHLETLFSVIRSHGGFNNNPNCIEFRRIIKRILMQNEIKASINSNCTNDNTNMLTVCTNDNTNILTVLENNQNENNAEVYENDDGLEELLNIPTLTETSNDIVIYISGFVERHFRKIIKCPDCLKGFDSNEIIYGELTFIKNRGGLINPLKDVYNICRLAESLLKSVDVKKPNAYAILMNQILRNVNISKTFLNASHASNNENIHKFNLVKKIIDYYLKIRMHHIAKQITIDSKKSFVRNKFTKMVLFYNQ